MLRSYGLDRFHKRLQELQLKSISKSSNYYGLSIILGGAESSLWEVTNAYAEMAGTLNYFNATSSEYPSEKNLSPSFVSQNAFDQESGNSKPSLFNAGSIYKAFEAMQVVNRPRGEENWDFFSSSQPIAWKTGTSFGFKDAWAVGVTPNYAIGVWVGNADGEGRPGLTGIQAAAPVLFEVLDVLPRSEWFATPYDELTEMEICSKSGFLAGVFCEQPEKQFVPKNGVRTSPCALHQKVFLDETRTFQVNSSCYPLAQMKQQSWFALPPVMEYYYSQKHPEYSPLPQFRNDCLRDGQELMEFIFPKKNETILLARDFNEHRNDIVFKVAHRGEDVKLYWYLDAQFIGMTDTFHELSLQPVPGKYLLTVVDQDGNEVQQKIAISHASNESS